MGEMTPQELKNSGLNTIHAIDFSTLKGIEGRNQAIQCVFVVGSDGKQGIFSHLTQSTVPLEYAQKLKGFYGGNSLPLVVSGGQKEDPFAQYIIEALVEEGFQIIGYDIEGEKGYWLRRIKLYSDRVEIQRSDYLEKDVQLRKFYFK